MVRDSGGIRLVGLGLTTMLVACGDPSGPGRPLAGAYVLQEANNSSPPLELEFESGRTQTLVSEELVFSRSGDVARTRTIGLRVEGRDTTVTEVIQHEYQVQGSTIEIGSFNCPPCNVCCIHNDFGTLAADTIELLAPSLLIGEQLAGGPPTLVYTKR